MVNILIAGGAGFIGSNLTRRLLNDGNRVTVIDNFISSSKSNIEEFQKNGNFELIEGDVTKEIPRSIDADYVFHLASPASPNHHSKISYHALPMETMMVNTIGTKNLLDFCLAKKAAFLFASTSEIYGDPKEHPQKEEYRGNVSTTGPRAIYDEAKRFGETITSYYWREKGINARIARIFNTYGPGMHKDDMRMLVNFMQQALSNRPITVFGDGSQTRSLCYVDDLVEGLVRLMFYENTNREIVNLGNPEEHTVMDYALLVKKLTNSSSEIVHSEELPTDDPLRRCPDIAKAKDLLSWEPKIALENGMLRMIEYIKSR